MKVERGTVIFAAKAEAGQKSTMEWNGQGVERLDRVTEVSRVYYYVAIEANSKTKEKIIEM